MEYRARVLEAMFTRPENDFGPADLSKPYF